LRIARDGRSFKKRANANTLAKSPHAKRIGKQMPRGEAYAIDHASILIAILSPLKQVQWLAFMSRTSD
jgi:hypothetical protein